MKKSVIFILFTLFIFNTYGQTIEEETEAIKNIIQISYVEGIQNEGNSEKIDRGVHPEFRLLGVGDDNQMWTLTIDAWKEKIQQRLQKGELPRKADNLISIKFLSVDIQGNAAVARFEFYVGEKLVFIDFISLYKFNEGWKMVSKIFYKFP
jgi:hypothetical protein